MNRLLPATGKYLIDVLRIQELCFVNITNHLGIQRPSPQFVIDFQNLCHPSIMPRYSEHDHRRPAAPAPNVRAGPSSTGGITQSLANMSISNRSASHKPSAEDEWKSIKKANPQLYDAIFNASDIMRKLEAKKKIRPFKVHFPTIRQAPPKTTAYSSSNGKQRAIASSDQPRSIQSVARPLANAVQPPLIKSSSSTQRIVGSSSSTAERARKDPRDRRY